MRSSLIRSYLSSRHQRVKFGTALSTWEGVLRGDPQGSVLGPTLFNICINDLAYAMTQCRIIDYADGTNIHCSNKNVRAVEDNLNSDLENATTWFNQNGMKPNPEKYQAMVLGRTEEHLLLNRIILILGPQKRLTSWGLYLTVSQNLTIMYRVFAAKWVLK